MKLVFLSALIALIAFLAFPAKNWAYFTSYQEIEHNLVRLADWTPPKTVLKFGTTTISENIVNGSFEDGLQGWTTTGDVQKVIVEKEDIVQIGKLDGSILQDNKLAQTIQNASKNLTFFYNVHTTETLSGFDDPAFEVKLNDAPILQVNSAEISGEGETRSTGWQRFSANLPTFPDTTLTISFSAGNTGDSQNQSWVEIKQVTTNTILANSSDTFSLAATDGQATTSFITDCSDTTREIQTTFRFDRSQQCEFNFWSKDSYENAEDPNMLPIDVNNGPPQSINDLQILREQNDEYVLEFATPEDGIASYDIRFSYTPIDETTNLDALEQIHQSQESFHTPQSVGTYDKLFLEEKQYAQQPFFVVRAVDVYGNIAPISQEL